MTPDAEPVAGDPAGAELAAARWPDLSGSRRRVVICPAGALEQHGPHLPLDTDTVLAARLAGALHARRPESVLAPAIPFGSSGEHGGFPGTLSIGTPALTDVVVELVRDACRWWRGVLVVNGHGGNLDALTAAAALCRREGRLLALTHVALPGMDAHAGHAETSLMLHLAPDRVRAGLAAPGRTEPVWDLLPRLRAEGVRAVSPNGVLGDPTGASAAAGARLFAGLVERAVADFDATFG